MGMVVKHWKTTVCKTVDASSSLAHSPKESTKITGNRQPPHVEIMVQIHCAFLIKCEVVAQQEERLPIKQEVASSRLAYFTTM